MLHGEFRPEIRDNRFARIFDFSQNRTTRQRIVLENAHVKMFKRSR